MTAAFCHACASEWLKRKRSLAAWLVIVGSFFTPVVVLVARLVHRDTLPKLYQAPSFWSDLWKSSWESMAIFFLPMGAILAASLIAQIEWKGNAWKQVHALPLGRPTIFFSKLGIVLVMMLQFFVLFNIGLYLSGALPSLLGGIPYPAAPLPAARFLHEDLLFFVDCLPIVAAQYLLSLRFRNFLVPIGIGFMVWVGALASISSGLSYLVPYSYVILDYLRIRGEGKVMIPPVNIQLWAIGYFLFFTGLGLVLFVTKRERG